MNIRFATLNDAETIAKNSVLLAKESEDLDVTLNETLNGVKGILNDPVKGFYLVAEDKGDIIGELMITYEWSDWRGKNMWWIQSAYVDKTWRKKGVFKQLVEEVKKLAKENNVDIIRLYVHNENKNAMKVYDRIGMKKCYTVYEA